MQSQRTLDRKTLSKIIAEHFGYATADIQDVVLPNCRIDDSMTFVVVLDGEPTATDSSTREEFDRVWEAIEDIRERIGKLRQQVVRGKQPTY